jgi:hypothetical protein
MMPAEVTIVRLRQRAAQYALAGAVAMVLWLVPGVASAQGTAPDPNSGRLTFTGGVDAPTVYVFRGILQEADPGITLWPYGDIGLLLSSGEGTVRSISVNVGVWNSLQTGSSGSKGFTEHAHYEEDFYSTLSLGLARGLTAGLTYTAYTSPNQMANTVKEVSVRLAQSGRINPYAVVAFEVGEFGADGGEHAGTYVELGAAPALPLGPLTLNVPVRLGMSLSNYYELDGVDHRFGYLDVGGVVTLPLSDSSSAFGAWNIHGGVSLLMFGDTTRAFNAGDSRKVVGLVGIGVAY